jgi:mannose-6-phosphate isomerase class I
MESEISKISENRKTDQYLMPSVLKRIEKDGYDIYPSFKIDGTIHSGYESLLNSIIGLGPQLMLDGYIGVNWDYVQEGIEKDIAKSGKIANWISINDFLKSDSYIESLTAPFIGGKDPLFGTAFTGDIGDFFDLKAISKIILKPDMLNIIYGTGAALANFNCPLVYFDLPKNEIQFRSRAGKVKNLGKSCAEDPKIQYKRFYFIDWVVLNKHKASIFKHVDIMVDEQRPDDITWVHGYDLKKALTDVSLSAFRARPWFEPGVWGGQWIKNNIKGLNNSVPNYAWSFELIAPENGIILENNGKLLEISIDSLLYHDAKGILGKAVKRFGANFPIRFDFLDTINGDNLSLQCHPTVDYTRKHFGENFTQDETYYILESEPGAEVYLGFQDNINREEFRNDLEESIENNKKVDVKKYIQTFPAQKHDLFLIPNGTVHCSGKGNVVLEISATPYIFTFKMYDWLRPDLNGLPRPLNIARAFENLDFTRKGEVVNDTLLSKSKIIKEGNSWRIIDLSTHPEHFYAIERLEFQDCIIDSTEDQCLVLSLVEGESITVITNDRNLKINYAETFIIPAAAGSFLIKNNGKSTAKVIKAYVKESSC